MEREILTLRSEKFDKDEYRQLLRRLAETDRELALRYIPQLALRSAMRIVPLLGASGHLDFWPEQDQFTHLTAILWIFNFPNNLKVLDSGDSARVDASRGALAASTFPEDFEVGFAARTVDRSVTEAAVAAAKAAAKAVADAANAAVSAPRARFIVNTRLFDVAVSAANRGAVFIEVSSSLYNALKIDIQIVQMADAEFEGGSLWWGAVPDFFTENLRKLETAVAQFSRIEGDKESWSTIDAGLNVLRLEASASRSSSQNTQAIWDSNPGEPNQSSVTGPSFLISFLSTNQSHPENPSATDKLNRQKLVNALAANLTHSTNRHHRAIGLLGEWGSGKSTVLKLLKQKLKEAHNEQPFVFGEFNAWSYEHSDNIQAGIAQEVLNAVTTVETYETPEKQKDEKRVAYLQRSLRPRMLNAFWRPIKSFVLRPWITFWFSLRTQKLQLLKSALVLFVALLPAMLASQKIDPDWFSWLGKLSEGNKTLLDNLIFQLLWGVGFGVYFLKEIRSLMANPLSKELLTYIRLPDYAKHLGDIPVMRENIKVMCNIRLGRLCGKPKRMLFVVDDLDRCSPAAIVKVLEAVRLVLDLENVIVLIAIDQNIALAALSDHFEDFAKHHKLKNSHAIAREYLSKVMNLPIVLTAPSGEDVEKFMTDMWKDMPEVPSTAAPNPAPPNLIKPKENADKDSGDGGAERQGEKQSKEDTNGGNTQSSPEIKQDKAPPAEHLSRQNVSNKNTSVDNKLVETANSFQALSAGQQESFIFWVNYFELTNPRQIKRLNNSYDLMRSYFDSWDKDEDRISFQLNEEKTLSVYPMLLTLILMEHLNSLTGLTRRAQLWQQLFDQNPKENPDAGDIGAHKVTQAFIAEYRRIPAQGLYESLSKSVEAFVLPAMAAEAKPKRRYNQIIGSRLSSPKNSADALV